MSFRDLKRLYIELRSGDADKRPWTKFQHTGIIPKKTEAGVGRTRLPLIQWEGWTTIVPALEECSDRTAPPCGCLRVLHYYTLLLLLSVPTLQDVPLISLHLISTSVSYTHTNTHSTQTHNLASPQLVQLPIFAIN